MAKIYSFSADNIRFFWWPDRIDSTKIVKTLLNPCQWSKFLQHSSSALKRAGSIQYSLSSMMFGVCSVQRALVTLSIIHFECVVCSVQCIECRVGVDCSVQCAVCSVQCEVCSV